MGRPTDGYKLPDGTKVPSVTEVIGRFKDSSALIGWAAKMAREGKDHRHEAAAAADIGHEVHAAIESYFMGGPYAAARSPLATNIFLTWRRWWEASGMVQDETELSMISRRLRTGGTVDVIATGVGGNRYVIDWKTSGALYPDQAIQLAAYRHMYHEIFPDKTPITHGLVVRLDKTRPIVQTWTLDTEALDRALYLFALYREAWDVGGELKTWVPKPQDHIWTATPV